MILALMLAAFTCRAENTEKELPIYGNFQLDSNDDGSLRLVGFYPENGMGIFDLSYDGEEGMPQEKQLFSGHYRIAKVIDENVFIVEFVLKSNDQKTTKKGRIRMECSETLSDGTEFYNYKITPLKGYDLGLPAGKTTELPISAWQAWD